MSQYEINSRLSRVEDDIKALRLGREDNSKKITAIEKELAVLKSGIYLQLDQLKTELGKTTTGISRTLWIGGSALITALAAWVFNGGLAL